MIELAGKFGNVLNQLFFVTYTVDGFVVYLSFRDGFSKWDGDVYSKKLMFFST